MKTAIVECAEVGGVCLNRGCIPAKALLKSAQVFETVKHSSDYGIVAGNAVPDIEKIVARAKNVSATMSKGIDMLFKKNKIDLIRGYGRIKSLNTVEVLGEENKELTATHIIVATGARPKELPSMPIDGKYILSYKHALFPDSIPESMVIAGSGAIGTEMAYFYNAMGTNVTLVEFMPHIVPSEDEDVSAQLSRSLRKAGIKVMTGSSVKSVTVSEGRCTVSISTGKGPVTVVCDKVLSAVGITANIENVGFENVGVETKKGKIDTDLYYRTGAEGVYAIGDIIPTTALAHAASSEAILCVEKIAGLNVKDLRYTQIPSCIYTTPEVASVGVSEQYALQNGLRVRTGKFPYSASGKAASDGNREGFVKLVFDLETDVILGAHLVGAGATEMISELAMAMKLLLTSRQIEKVIHPHPTMSEAIAEAAAAANGDAIHL
jgi:dihydrolipoamide dehydrogenase